MPATRAFRNFDFCFLIFHFAVSGFRYFDI